MTEESTNCLKERTPFKIEFMNDNGEYHRLSSYIKKLFDEYMLIEQPKTEGIHQEIPVNSQVNLIFPLENGVFIAQCEIFGKEESLDQGIMVSYPYETEVLERREYVRIPLKIRTEISYYPDENSTEKLSFFVKTRNISGSGLCYLHTEPFEDYPDIQCKIYLNDENPNPVITKCKHIHSKKVKVKGEIQYLTALTYISISDKDITRIVKECFKYQIERRHIKNN